MVVTSTAVRPGNPEVVEAHRRGIPVIPRAEMLAELLKMKFSIAVSGSHGKTTTTSMIATVLASGGVDPTMVIGGKLGSIGSNAKIGAGEIIVAEADESDGSFLKLNPCLAVITNIDREHLDHYRDIEEIKAAFLRFANIVPFYGATVVCLDDPHVREILPDVTRRVITYGIDRPADYSAQDVTFDGPVTTFSVLYRGEPLGPVTLNVPGRFNVYNALAYIAAAREIDMDYRDDPRGLGLYRGVHRRLELKGQAGGRVRGGRLRPPPHGDPGDPRRGPPGVERPDDRRLPAPSLQPDPGPLRGVPDGLPPGRRADPHGYLSGQ